MRIERLDHHADSAPGSSNRRRIVRMLQCLFAGLQGFVLIGCTTGLTAADTHRLRIDDVELSVEMDRGLRSGRGGHPWTEWLETSLRATGTVTGGFPRDAVRIELESTSRASGAIAFGQIRRSTPPRIRFYVSPDASLDELNADWRGYHEFAHLLIPFPGNDDIWFTEGFASYYQYLLQSRAGVISPRRAWEELLDGFARGERDRSGRGRTLRSLSPDMWRERAHKRVYWTGAAFFLRVDTRLRSESGGRHSLDKTLAAFHVCCMDDRRRWDAQSLIETLGELSLPGIWRQEYRKTIDAPAGPVYERALERLGIAPRRSGLRLSSAPEHRALRDSIAGTRLDAGDGRLAEFARSLQDASSSAP